MTNETLRRFAADVAAENAEWPVKVVEILPQLSLCVHIPVRADDPRGTWFTQSAPNGSPTREEALRTIAESRNMAINNDRNAEARWNAAPYRAAEIERRMSDAGIAVSDLPAA